MVPNIPEYSSWNYIASKRKTLDSFEMSGTNYPVMQDHIPEEWNPLTHHFTTTASAIAKKKKKQIWQLFENNNSV
jgi:hypothetical protein